MIILVLADSHGYQHLMHTAIKAVHPDAIIHLGDYYSDGEALREAYPNTVIHQVMGNCDKGRVHGNAFEALCYPVCGVKLYMAHGHNHDAKHTTYYLVEDGKAEQAKAVLYGHSHIPDCRQLGDMWILNPGTCRNDAGSVGVIAVDQGEILACRILRLEELEEML